jgi:uncharacterized membrane protein YcfT
MSFDQHRDSPSGRTHIAWADYAKGLCIVLVVMLYANELVEHTAGRGGWLDLAVSFAKPFRMPDFFLVSGVLLTLAIGREWRTFLDRKVVHFAYFYLLWLTILVAFESPWTAARAGWSGVGALYLRSLGNPYSMLWFIYLLPIFFVVTKAVRRAPIALIWLIAAALQVAQIDTGIKVADKFAAYYVFFYSGYAFARWVLRIADAASARPRRALAALALWGVAEGWLVWSGYALLPGISLVLGLIGAGAVVAVTALMTRAPIFRPLAYCGRNSLVVYLAFAVPLAVASKLLFAVGWISDVGSIALIATIAAVLGPLLLHRLVRGTRLRFLFERPAWTHIAGHSSEPAPTLKSAHECKLV